jgi:phosphatidylglycerol:prolipoprotein diacylglycerol transferase
MVAYVLIFAFLWSRRTTVQRPGVLFWGYLVLSGLARFGLEFVRVNPPLLLGLSMSQVISVPLIAIGAYMLVKRDTPDTRDAATNAGQPVPKLQKLASENRR